MNRKYIPSTLLFGIIGFIGLISFFLSNNILFQQQIVHAQTSSPPGLSLSPNPTVPVPTSCVCGTDNTCDSTCPFNKVSCAGGDNKCPVYAAKVSCLNENASGLTQDIKDSYCKRPYRLQGDADANNQMDDLDYFYYVRYVNGGTVPDNVNPDFSGDGLVSITDRNIIVRTLGSIVVPTVIPENTATPSPTGNGTNPTQNNTITPTLSQSSATVTSTPTPIVGSPNPTSSSTTVSTTPQPFFCSRGSSCKTWALCKVLGGNVSGQSCGKGLFCCFGK